MELTFTIDAGNHLLRATLAGPFSLSEAETTFIEILEGVIQHQAKKVLIDGRTIMGKPTTMERFYYGKLAAEEVTGLRRRGVAPIPQFAYVLLPPVLDSQRFGECVAVNRGMHLKVFDNLPAAEQWLEIAPSSH